MKSYDVPITEEMGLDEVLESCERIALIAMLTQAGGNVTRAAGLAKRNRSAFYDLLKKHALNADDYRKETNGKEVNGAVRVLN